MLYPSNLFCKDSASRAQYKKSWLFFVAEAPPILSKDSASRLFARRLSYLKIVQAVFLLAAYLLQR